MEAARPGPLDVAASPSALLVQPQPWEHTLSDLSLRNHLLPREKTKGRPGGPWVGRGSGWGGWWPDHQAAALRRPGQLQAMGMSSHRGVDPQQHPLGWRPEPFPAWEGWKEGLEPKEWPWGHGLPLSLCGPVGCSAPQIWGCRPHPLECLGSRGPQGWPSYLDPPGLSSSLP